MKLFGHHLPSPILVLAGAEFSLTAIAFLFASILSASSWSTSLALIDGDVAKSAVGFSFAVVIGLTAMGLYQPKQRLGTEAVLVRLFVGLIAAAVGIAVIDFLFPLMVRKRVWAASFLLTSVLLGTSRAVFGRIVDTEAFRRRILIYGAGERAASLLKLRRRSDQRGFKIVGFVPAPGDRTRIADDRVISIPGTLLDFAQEHAVTEIVVAMDERRTGFPIKELLDCKFAGIAVVDLLNFLERETGRVKVDLVNPAWLIFSEGFARPPARSMLCRALDLSVASFLLLFSLPLMALVAIAILLEDGAPVLYRQSRVGLNGTVFTLYKFRSMVKNAESDGRPQWAGKGDPRVTRIGGVIRKLRVDELPQLFNVIRGDMRLVGPRPERPEFVECLARKIPYYHERHSVKPGITGWAQLSYPYGSSEEDAMEKLQYDLYYVKHRSILFDLMVMLQTVEVVLWGKGAR
jgi:sugar transferase (PEP-CTERM system associated)